jgi:cytochrome c-type biogenesis protein CcmH/NrfG
MAAMESIPRRRRVVSMPRPVARVRRRAPVWGRGSAALGVLLPLALLLGCSSPAWQGARLYRSGTAALDRGDVQQSVADLERAAALLPDKSEIHNHLGIAYVSAGRLEEAIASFERAAALDCTNDPAQDNLRVVRARMASRTAGPQAPAAAAPRGGAPGGEGAGETGEAPARRPAPMLAPAPRGDRPEDAPPAPSDAGGDGV